jgi:hypothetical protein
MATLTLTPSLFDQDSAFEQASESGRETDLGHARMRALASGTSVLDRPARGATLEDLITAVWSEIRLGSATSCPVCHGELRPVWSAGSRPVGGRCADCGTRLS